MHPTLYAGDDDDDDDDDADRTPGVFRWRLRDSRCSDRDRSRRNI